MKQMRQRVAKGVYILLAGALLGAGMPLLSEQAEAASNTITLDKSATHQEIWGFGAAANHVVADLYSNPLYAGVRDDVMDRLFRTTGDLSTGLSIIRWEINPFTKTETGIQKPSFYYNQATVRPDPDTWDWDTDYHQKWFADEALRRNPDMQFMAVPWTPPTWMKDVEKDTLKSEHYDDFAEYISTWLEKYKTGVPFSAVNPTLGRYNFKWVSIQNEPDISTNYGSSKYDAASDQIGKVAVKVKQAIQEKGLDVKVGAPETTSRTVAVEYLKAMSPESLAALDFIAVHDYGATADLSAYGKTIMTTEVCYTTSNNPEIVDGLNEAQSVYNALMADEPGWMRWWFAAESLNGEPLIHLGNGSYSTNKRLYTLGQFSRFMRPGDVRIDADSSNPNLKVVATKNAQNNASIVVINSRAEDYTVNINGLNSNVASVYRTSDTEDIASLGPVAVSNGSVSYTFPAKSVTTIVEGTADASSTVTADPHMARFSTEPNPDPHKIYPSGDTFAKNGVYADTTFNTLTTLEVKAQPGFDNPNFTRKAFLQFDLGSIAEPIESVTLNIFGKTDAGTVPGLALFALEDNDWSDSTLTWNRMPAITGSPLAYFSQISTAKTKFSIDVTEAALGKMATDKKLSLAIMDTLGADQMARFDSMDNEWSIRPHLIVKPSLWPADRALTASGITENSMTLTWTPASSPSGIVDYSLYKNGDLLQTVDGSTLSYEVNNLVSGNTYHFQVKAQDGSGRITSDGPALTIKSGDHTPPTWGQDAALEATGISARGLTLLWPSAMDDGGIAKYLVYRGGTLLQSLPSTRTSLDISGLAPGTRYSFAVVAEDGSGNSSALLEAQAVTLADGDTAAPVWNPGSTIQVSGLTRSQASLQWPAAYDNTGVAAYRIYENGRFVANSTATGYRASGLADNTSYTYKVEAMDGAGNLSVGGPEVIFRTLGETDTIQPNWFEPKFTSSNFTEDGFTLTWSGAKDRGGVTAYRIYNGATEVVTLPAHITSFDIRGVNPSAALNYKVEAGDGAGNWSTTGPAITPAVPDTVLPFWPDGRSLVYSNVSDTSVVLTWTPANDDREVAQYKIYRNGTLITTVAGTVNTYTASGLTKSNLYSFKVEAGDAAGNWTVNGPAVSVTTLAGVTVNPPFNLYPTEDVFFHEGNSEVAPDRLKVKNDKFGTTNRRAYLKFDLSSVTGSVYKATLHLYNFEMQGSAGGINASADLFTTGDNWSEANPVWSAKPPMGDLLGSVPINSTTNTPLGWIDYNVTDYVDAERRGDGAVSFGIDDLRSNNNFYSFYSKDTTTNTDKKPYLSVATQSAAADAAPPVWNSGMLEQSGIRPESVQLSWSGAWDEVGINGYRIMQDGNLIATVAADVYGYRVSGLAPGHSYTFKVEAGDVSHWSSDGPSVAVTTAVPDTSAPLWPQGSGLIALGVTRSGADLQWTPATDDWGVEQYRIYRGTELLDTVGGNVHHYSVAGLVPGTEYTFKVEAGDLAGNWSSAGPTVAVATLPPDASAPQWPEGADLLASLVSDSGAQLIWPAASDDEAVKSYAIYQDDALIMETAGYITSYYVHGLTGGTAYRFGVKPVDDSGKISAELGKTVMTEVNRDTITPQWPTGSAVTHTAGTDRIVLGWNPAVDNKAVTGYRVWMNDHELATVGGDSHSYSVVDLTEKTAYAFKIEAVDAAGNWSENGPGAVVTTAAVSQPPSNPPADPPANPPAPSGGTGPASVTVRDHLIAAANPVLDPASGEARAVIDLQSVKTAFGNAKAGNGNAKTITVQLAKAEGAAAYTSVFPAEVLVSGGLQNKIEIVTEFGSVEVSGSMLAQAGLGQAGEIGITVAAVDASELPPELRIKIGDRPVIDLKVTANGKRIAYDNPDAPMTIAIPYTPSEAERNAPEHIVGLYLDGNVRAVAIPTGRYDAAKGMVVMSVTHFGKYAVAYVKTSFGDIGDYEWARKEIEVLASKGIINGTAENVFTPSTNITRADFTLLLVKALGITAKVDVNFADVGSDAYYYEAVGIAKKLGLVEGREDNRFHPAESISRQDMVVIAARAMQKLGRLQNYGSSAATFLAGFSDKAELAAYAEEAVAAMVKEDLIQGSGGAIHPQKLATRAEAAVMLYRIYNHP